MTGMTILSYGSSTWADFIEAYNANKVVYCRASSGSNPASGSQTRLAFMAYVSDATNPTSVEFQYYRSVNTHSASQQGDQTYVYKLDKTAGWTVTVRENYSKIIAGTNMTSSYSNSQITLNATVPTKTSDLTNDSGFVTSADIPEGAAASQTTPAMDGTASTGTETTFARGDHVHPSDTSKQDTLVSGTNIKTINNTSLLGSGDISISGGDTVTVTQTQSSGTEVGQVSVNGTSTTLYAPTPPATYAGSSSAGGNATRANGILYAEVDSTSTSTYYTVTIPGVTEYYDGLTIMLKNGVVTSAANFTIDVNSLGGKPSYNNMTTGNDVTPTAPTRDTTIFNINYTMLITYCSTIVSGGGWICYRGYDANTNTIGYQIRTNSSTLPMKSITYRYRILFTSGDGAHWVPATNSTSTNATASRTVCQDKIDPFGEIVYYGTTSSVAANAKPSASSLWQEYAISLGYSFNKTGSDLVLTYPAPVYVKCAPQTDGSAIIDADTPYVQALPSTEDNKIYIFLGLAYNATNIELRMNHPVYYHDGTGIRAWQGAKAPKKTSDLTNDSGFITGISSTDVTTALGYTPYNATNPDSYVNATQAANAAPVQSVNGSTGAVTVNIPSASSTTPSMDGTASAGSETAFARGDHVHPTDTSRASASDVTSLTTRVGTLENAGYQTASDVQALITQSDWSETDNTDSSYIANKPSVKSGEGTNSIVEGQLSDYSEAVVYTLQITGEANATTYSYTVSLTDPANTALPTGTELRRSAIAVYNSTDCRTVLSLDSTNTTITLNKTLKSSAISGDTLMVYYKYKTAIAEESHVEGHMTRAGDKYSHAEGNQTMAGGESSHSEGMYTNAIGNYSHAEGYDTIVRGQAAHAEGWACQTLNYGCHAEGYGSLAWGVCSHAEGNHTTAQCQSQHVFGEYNVVDSGATGSRGTYVEIVGKGTAENARSNARTLDWSGNETLAGRLTLGAVPVSNMDAATKQYVDTSYVIAGKKANTTLGNKATAEGSDTTASYAYAHAEGELTQATEYASHAEGVSSQAKGYASHAEGYSTTASGSYSHAEGNGTKASQTCAHAEGYGTYATGGYSHAEGNGTTASTSCAHAEGSGTQATGNYSHAEGYSGQASGYCSHKEGQYTYASGYCSHSEGASTYASGDYSHAEGVSTQASGYQSHVEGVGTIAHYSSQHVFGEYNIIDPIENTSTSERGTYIEIVGNGTLEYDEEENDYITTRSNARTLDWSGNEVLAGKLTVGAGPTNNMDVATKQYVDSHSSSYTLPTASTSTLGGVKVDGSSITISNGVISATPASPSGPVISATTVTLTASGWSNSSQTVNVTGVTASNIVIVTYTPSSKTDYVAADIICSAQGAGTLTFVCYATTPSSDIAVNVLVIDNTVSAAAGNNF